MASRPDRHAAATSLAVNLSAERSGSRDFAFLDVADGTEGLDVITANAEALAKARRPGRDVGTAAAALAGSYAAGRIVLLPKIPLSCAGDFPQVRFNGQDWTILRNLPPSPPVTSPPLQCVAGLMRQAVSENNPNAVRRAANSSTNASDNRHATESVQ